MGQRSVNNLPQPMSKILDMYLNIRVDEGHSEYAESNPKYKASHFLHVSLLSTSNTLLKQRLLPLCVCYKTTKNSL